MYSGPIRFTSPAAVHLYDDSDFTVANARAKIREVLARHNERASTLPELELKPIKLSPEQVEQGALLLVAKKDQYRDLNSPFVSAYIRKIMPAEVGAHIAFQPFSNTPPTFLTAKPLIACAKEVRNVKMIRDLAGSNENVNNKRLSSFVIALGAPELPTRHPGTDSTYHPDKDLDPEYLDLLERANTTLQYIQKLEKKEGVGKACPKVVFLRGPVKESDDALTRRIHKGHTLADFKQNIVNETQFPITFHFAGHGNPEKVGAMTEEKRFTPEDLAGYFHQIVQDSELTEVLLSKKQPLVFHFDVCNSAFIDIDPDDMSESVIKRQILNQSVIGKFAQHMVELGYKNIIVHGYRGYYTSQNNGAGIFVTDRVDNNPHKPFFKGEKVLHTIEMVEGKKPSVKLPQDPAMATFPVMMLVPLPRPEF